MRIRFWLVLVACIALAGCRVAVYTRAPEVSANEVLSALLEGGVDAEKLAVDEKTFNVEVARSDLTRALAVLRLQGLPRDRNDTLGDLFKKEGLVSTPAEERVRFIYGVSQELEKTILKIDGVVQGRVHIVLPANDPLADVQKPSSASVFVKYRPPADPDALGPLVRSLVVRGIEGLDTEHVSVAFVAAEPPDAARALRLVHWLGMKVPDSSVPALNAFAGASLILPFAIFFGLQHREKLAKAARRARAQARGESGRDGRSRDGRSRDDRPSRPPASVPPSLSRVPAPAPKASVQRMPVRPLP